MLPILHVISDLRETYTWEGDWLSYLLRDFHLVHHYDPDAKCELAPAVLVAARSGSDNGRPPVTEYLARLAKRGQKAGLIHLSDEWFEANLEGYANAAFIFRNYYRAGITGQRAEYLGLGWKTGFREALVEKPISERGLMWSFAGMVKATREGMIKSAQRVPGGKLISATGFGGQGGGLGTREYAQMLNDTVFALCPRGNSSVDCFRIYEAFEAGCIPIVEDDGGWDLAGELLWPGNFIRVEAWRRSYWKYHFKNPLQRSYWLSAYGNEFPAPRIMHWETLDRLLARISIQEVAQRCQNWWCNYKETLRQRMAKTIHEKLFAGKE